MKLSRLFFSLIVGFALTQSAVAATFTVDIAADDASAHDANVGDGVCADADGFCTLRAAIEEANSTAIADFILFGNFPNQQTLTLAASEGPLPAITNPLAILASSIAIYNSNATSPLDAPPMFIIDGSQLSGLPSGLVFQGNASGSAVTALGIVNFGGNGILMRQAANNVSIGGCYIGILANGSAAGNGFNGIHAFVTDDHKIGQFEDSPGFGGLGNIVSSNGQSGIRLESSANNKVLGNVIGIAPNGQSGRGNGRFGIDIAGDNNRVGAVRDGQVSRNYIAANALGGITIAGDQNNIYSNRFGSRIDLSGGIASAADAIRIVGETNIVGGFGNFANSIDSHAGAAIRMGISAGLDADNNFVTGNVIGRTVGNGSGILIDNGDLNVIQDNTVVGSTNDGVIVLGNDNRIRRNLVGVFTLNLFTEINGNGAGISVNGNRNIIGDEQGALETGTGNVVGASDAGGISTDGNFNQVIGNFVGVDKNFADRGNQGDGLLVQGSDAIVRKNVVGFNGGSGFVLDGLTDSAVAANQVGIASDGRNIGNQGFGLLVTNSAQMLDLQINKVAYNGNAGIGLDDTVTQVFIGANTMHNNQGLGIDLGNNGITMNDPGDADEGANRLQNFPLIESALWAIQGPFTTLTVAYRVSSLASNADYPLFIDFYWSNVDEEPQGRIYLGRATYATPDVVSNHLLELPPGTLGGWVTATATDGLEGVLGVPVNLNTSEFAARVVFGTTSGLIFSDSFELP